jgi:hypothetical protein
VKIDASAAPQQGVDEFATAPLAQRRIGHQLLKE